LKLVIKPKLLYFIAIIVLTSGAEIFSQQLVYEPINPSFGGSPLNGNWLLSSAQLQDDNEDPAAAITDDPLADFQDALNRSVLNQLSRSLTESLFGERGLEEGRFELGDFVIDVTQTLDGVNIVIFDLISGNETTIFIPFI
jgi:curli production assembly/transport component CsgF